MNKPIVTVDSWTLDDVLQGREFVFHDDGNPDLKLQVRVWVENGAMYASITHVGGFARTGAYRRVKPCSQVPNEPKPEPTEPDPTSPPTRRAVIFGSNLGAVDYQDLADPSKWEFGSQRIAGVHCYFGHFEPGAAFVNPNGWPALSALVAKVKEWGLLLEIEMGAGEGIPKIDEVFNRIHDAGGAMGSIVFDQAFHQSTPESWAERHHAIKERYPSMILGAWAPFPFKSVADIRATVERWAELDALPAFLRMDIDYNQRYAYTASVHAQMRALCDQFRIGLEGVINAKEHITDAQYVQQAKEWFDRAVTLGSWDGLAVLSWASTPSDNQRLLPHNLPESDPSAHTNLLRHVLERYTVPAPQLPEPPAKPEPLPEPEPIEIPPGRAAFETNSGHVWAAKNGGGDEVNASSKMALGADELFALHELGGNQVAITANSGHYVAVETDGRLMANRDGIGEWEKFTREYHPDGTISLRSWLGKYVCAEDGGGGLLIANRDASGPWESFTVLGTGGHANTDKLNGRLRANGRFFENDGGIFRPVFTSGLSLLARPDDQVLAFLDWASRIGFNGVRVFGGHLAWANQTAPGARSRLPWLLEQARARGLYVEVTSVTDSGPGGYDVEQHVKLTAEICNRYDNTLLEIANEPYHGTQIEAVHSAAFLRRLGQTYAGDVLYSLGAPSDDESLEMRDAKYLTPHLSRSRDRWNQVRRVRELENSSNATGLPWLNNEPVGSGEIDTGSRLSDPAFFFCMGALNRIFEGGGVHHSQHGLDATLPGPRQQQCATAFVQGSTIVPTRDRLAFKNATWADSPVASANFDGGGVVRVYSGVYGNKGVMCYVGDNGQANVQMKNGWSKGALLGEYQSPADGRWCRVFEISR